MKIAFIVSKFPSLSQTFILNQITGLINLGCDVEIFARSNPQDKIVHPDVEKYHLIERTYYYNFPRNKIKRVLKAIYLLITNFHKDSIKILKLLNITRNENLSSSLQLFYILIPFLNRKFDIIQCHFGSSGNIGAFLKELGIKGKLVTMFHGYDIRNGIEQGGKIYNQLLNYGDCFLVISDYNYKNLVRFGVKTEKLVFHPVGVEIDKFPFKWKGNKNLPSPIIILTVARLVEEKGLKYSITAIKEILMNNSDLHLKYYIVGEGVLKESLINLVKKLKLGDIVKFLGSMDQLQVAKEMLMAHIFLLPSISEALPVVLMEAQAIGLPIIATDVGSVAEAIVDSRSGFLVPSRDVNALVEKIEYLIEHPEVWPKMGRYGRKFIEENYDIKKLNQRLLEIYQNLIKGKYE